MFSLVEGNTATGCPTPIFSIGDISYAEHSAAVSPTSRQGANSQSTSSQVPGIKTIMCTIDMDMYNTVVESIYIPGKPLARVIVEYTIR